MYGYVKVDLIYTGYFLIQALRRVEKYEHELVGVPEARQTRPLGNRHITDRNGILAQPQANELIKFHAPHRPIMSIGVRCGLTAFNSSPLDFQGKFDLPELETQPAGVPPPGDTKETVDSGLALESTIEHPEDKVKDSAADIVGMDLDAVPIVPNNPVEAVEVEKESTSEPIVKGPDG